MSYRDILALIDSTKRERDEARYQIERTIAQLETALDGVYDKLPDTTDSVVAQLGAYLKSVE